MSRNGPLARPQILELSCDHYAAPPAAGGQQPDLQRFESRMLAPLTSLKYLSLREFGSADLSRLPPSLETLHLDIYTALPLVLPERLRLQELALAATRLLVDWPRLCSQVGRVLRRAALPGLCWSQGSPLWPLLPRPARGLCRVPPLCQPFGWRPGAQRTCPRSRCACCACCAG